MMSNREKEALDRWITGNYGEDSYAEDKEELLEEDEE